MLQVLSSGSWSFGCVCCLREPPSETLVRSFLMINLHNTCYNFVLHIPKPCQLENQTIFCSNGNDPQPPPSMQLWLQAELSHSLRRWTQRSRCYQLPWPGSRESREPEPGNARQIRQWDVSKTSLEGNFKAILTAVCRTKCTKAVTTMS